ncbi:hypothetical protein JB92DRAFT_2977040 [Gautieria morchelliformis]|nr:hypothetical protein JB92DRAFT_2977040 [Gautieria morchelliformis]
MVRVCFEWQSRDVFDVVNTLYSTRHEEPVSQTQPNPWSSVNTPEVHQASCESVATDGATTSIIRFNDCDNSRRG